MSANQIVQAVSIIGVLTLTAFCIYMVVKTASLPKDKQREMGICIGHLDPEEKYDYRVQDLIRSVAEMNTDNVDQLLLIRNKARRLIEDKKETR